MFRVGVSKKLHLRSQTGAARVQCLVFLVFGISVFTLNSSVASKKLSILVF